MATIQIAYLALEVPGLQYARPVEDVLGGFWTPSEGTDLYAMVAEATADDATYIYSDPTPVDDRVEFRLSSIDQPVNRGVTIYIRGSRG